MSPLICFMCDAILAWRRWCFGHTKIPQCVRKRRMGGILEIYWLLSALRRGNSFISRVSHMQYVETYSDADDLILGYMIQCYSFEAKFEKRNKTVIASNPHHRPLPHPPH